MLEKASPDTFQCLINSLCLRIFYYSLTPNFCLPAYLFWDLFCIEQTIHTDCIIQGASRYFLLFKGYVNVVSLNCCRHRLYAKLGNRTFQPQVCRVWIYRTLGSIMMNDNTQKDLSPMPTYRVQTTDNAAMCYNNLTGFMPHT